MQTFLPYSGFRDSAKVLDRVRLGNQRREAKGILNSLLHGGGWNHHRAAKMWEGYEKSLATYGVCICEEWISRGYKDNLLPFFRDNEELLCDPNPPWLGDERVHSSHRAALLAKNLEWYSQFNWKEVHVISYYWPV